MPFFKKIISLSVTIVLCLVSFINSLSCKDQVEKPLTTSDKATKIEELISLYEAYEGFSGSLLVSHKGEVVFKKGFGYAQREWDVPNTPDTKFRIASVTKPFTAVLIMQLVAEHKLDLHAPISTYLPAYPKHNGEQVNIHQLLTHTAGIVRDYDSDIPFNKYPDRQQPSELVAQFSDLPLEFTPGEKFTYSNSGFMVLGHIIETVTGKSYESVLQEKILTPLGMKNTGVDKHRPLLKNRAKGYYKAFGDYYNADYSDMSNIPAVGNLYATVEDLSLLDQALYTETLLPKKYRDLMFAKHVSDPSYGGHHGYGWELIDKSIGNTKNTVATIGHSGSIQGFCALLTRVPSSNSTVIFLNNTSRAYLNTMTKAIIGILNNTTYDFPKKPTAKFMSEVIAKDGIDAGILFYKEHKDLDDYYIDEVELIVAGYRLLHAGNAIDAAAVFKLSIEVFPNRDNPYDSYAEALMALGKNEEAIKNYKKSLELNPNNNNAVEMLKKLEK